MKKLKLLTSIILTASLVLTGCSLGSDADTRSAQEYINDDLVSSVETSGDAASAEDSIIVVDNLFEPLLNEIAASAESSTISNEAENASATDAATAAASTETASGQELTEDEIEASTVRIVFFGDSQFANGRSDGSSIPEMIGTRVPCSVIYNMGIGGTTAALELSTSETDPAKVTTPCFVGMTSAFAGEADRNTILEDHHDVLNTMNSVNPANVDYYFISYGANDFFSNIPLDTDIYNPDQLHYYYNALNIGISKLREISPNAQFILVSPFYSVYYNSEGSFMGDSYVVSNGIGTLAKYADKCHNVSEDLETYFFDGMYRTKFDLYLDTADQYLIDGVHFTLRGRQIIGRLLAHYVNYMQMNEPFAYLDTDFVKIEEYDTEEYYRYDEALMKAYYPESWAKYIAGVFPLAQPSEEALSWDN